MMSSTRLLILGVLKKRALHGYEVRHQLELWNAEQWANVAYGSIYFALKKMAEEGLVEEVGTDQVGNRPARTVYAITEDGRLEFERLLRDYWWEYKPAIDPFQVALTFMNQLPREEVLAALRQRADGLRAFLATFEQAVAAKMSHDATPRHIAHNLRLAAMHAETELRWIEETIGMVERGELP
jgi:DNA-binding PadR family transcriptional regulator